ncbi:hypothetical protein PPK15_gp07 [Bacillus phage 000TH010]|uniref:Uncharacterized protein n=1 Tax=Bacillus phage 000TH010 TaxID=2601652 RepID=A0A5P8PJH7_9CAUD|nr:hypothetical protein PPK15_gp07 [Bacillus phage 000TH010]QFR56220.1 hypothetical protein 000TH010_7 [Bacillus phage 000TH010]
MPLYCKIKGNWCDHNKECAVCYEKAVEQEINHQVIRLKRTPLDIFVDAIEELVENGKIDEEHALRLIFNHAKNLKEDKENG